MAAAATAVRNNRQRKQQHLLTPYHSRSGTQEHSLQQRALFELLTLLEVLARQTDPPPSHRDAGPILDIARLRCLPSTLRHRRSRAAKQSLLPPSLTRHYRPPALFDSQNNRTKSAQHETPTDAGQRSLLHHPLPSRRARRNTPRPVHTRPPGDADEPHKHALRPASSCSRCMRRSAADCRPLSPAPRRPLFRGELQSPARLAVLVWQ